MTINMSASFFYDITLNLGTGDTKTRKIESFLSLLKNDIFHLSVFDSHAANRSRYVIIIQIGESINNVSNFISTLSF